MAPAGNQNAKGNRGGTGRPTTYRDGYSQIAQKMYELGATDSQVASALDVTVDVIRQWKFRKPEFCHAFKLGREIPDRNVKQSLYESCFSEDYVEEREILDAEGNVIQKVRQTKRRHADTSAAMFWLRNRCPDEFARGNEPEVTFNQIIRLPRATPEAQLKYPTLDMPDDST